jgi:hypothetical protein
MVSDVSTAGVAITYCERWSGKQKAPIVPLIEDEARARHEHGELYTAVLGDHEMPKLVEVSFNEGYIGVRWLEAHGKDVLRYAFRPQEDRWFLTEVSVNTVSAEGRVAKSESTLFKPDGSAQLTIVDNANGVVEVRDPTTGNDLSALWEDTPEFGDYDSIARRER